MADPDPTPPRSWPRGWRSTVARFTFLAPAADVVAQRCSSCHAAHSANRFNGSSRTCISCLERRAQRRDARRAARGAPGARQPPRGAGPREQELWASGQVVAEMELDDPADAEDVALDLVRELGGLGHRFSEKARWCNGAVPRQRRVPHSQLRARQYRSTTALHWTVWTCEARGCCQRATFVRVTVALDLETGGPGVATVAWWEDPSPA